MIFFSPRVRPSWLKNDCERELTQILGGVADLGEAEQDFVGFVEFEPRQRNGGFAHEIIAKGPVVVVNLEARPKLILMVAAKPKIASAKS